MSNTYILCLSNTIAPFDTFVSRLIPFLSHSFCSIGAIPSIRQTKPIPSVSIPFPLPNESHPKSAQKRNPTTTTLLNPQAHATHPSMHVQINSLEETTVQSEWKKKKPTTHETNPPFERAHPIFIPSPCPPTPSSPNVPPSAPLQTPHSRPSRPSLPPSLYPSTHLPQPETTCTTETYKPSRKTCSAAHHSISAARSRATAMATATSVIFLSCKGGGVGSGC